QFEGEGHNRGPSPRLAIGDGRLLGVEASLVEELLELGGGEHLAGFLIDKVLPVEVSAGGDPPPLMLLGGSVVEQLEGVPFAEDVLQFLVSHQAIFLRSSLER